MWTTCDGCGDRWLCQVVARRWLCRRCRAKAVERALTVLRGVSDGRPAISPGPHR